MIQVEFIFNNTVTPFEADLYSPFQYAIDAFIQQSLLDKNLIYFTFNGEIINPQQTILNKIQQLNIRTNKIQIYVLPRNGNQIYNSNNYNNQISINSQNVYPSYSEIQATPNYPTKYSNTLTSVSSMNDTSYQSSAYNNTPYNSELNEFTIIYKMENKKNQIKIFNKKFVETNKNKCYLLVNGNKTNLCEFLQLNDALRKLDTLEIKLIEVEPMTDISSKFRDVRALLSLPDISNLNTSNITKMGFLFAQCTSLQYLPPFLNWDTSHVTDMSAMFDECSALTTLPDISNWDLRNVEDFRAMFSNCSSLISIPDISRWDTRKNTDLSFLFFKCRKLISLPDISNWNTSNVKNIELFI